MHPSKGVVPAMEGQIQRGGGQLPMTAPGNISVVPVKGPGTSGMQRPTSIDQNRSKPIKRLALTPIAAPSLFAEPCVNTPPHGQIK